jgi:hypothetical protein
MIHDNPLIKLSLNQCIWLIWSLFSGLQYELRPVRARPSCRALVGSSDSAYGSTLLLLLPLLPRNLHSPNTHETILFENRFTLSICWWSRIDHLVTMNKLFQACILLVPSKDWDRIGGSGVASMLIPYEYLAYNIFRPLPLGPHQKRRHQGCYNCYSTNQVACPFMAKRFTPPVELSRFTPPVELSLRLLNKAC